MSSGAGSLAHAVTCATAMLAQSHLFSSAPADDYVASL